MPQPKKIEVEVVPVPVTLCRLLMADKKDFKNPDRYDESQKVSKALLRVIVEAHK